MTYCKYNTFFKHSSYEFFAGGTEIEDDVSSVHSVLTEEERFRLREVIMTDERIQTILKETHTTEKMLQLKDYRYVRVYSRVLSIFLFECLSISKLIPKK